MGRPPVWWWWKGVGAVSVAEITRASVVRPFACTLSYDTSNFVMFELQVKKCVHISWQT